MRTIVGLLGTLVLLLQPAWVFCAPPKATAAADASSGKVWASDAAKGAPSPTRAGGSEASDNDAATDLPLGTLFLGPLVGTRVGKPITKESSSASPLDSARTGAGTPKLREPQILQPTIGSRARAGLRVQVAPPAGGDYAAAEVLFTWVPAHHSDPQPATPRAPAVTWTTTMRDLARGAIVPAGSAPSRTGRWTVKARAIGASGPGAWSPEVGFYFETATSGDVAREARTTGKHDAAALNPQPLPPRDAGSAGNPQAPNAPPRAPSAGLR